MVNSAYHMTNKIYLFKQLHASSFSPFKPTWIRAIQKGCFQSRPGLTVQLVTKYLPNIVATAKLNIYQVRKYAVKTFHR